MSQNLPLGTIFWGAVVLLAMYFLVILYIFLIFKGKYNSETYIILVCSHSEHLKSQETLLYYNMWCFKWVKITCCSFWTETIVLFLKYPFTPAEITYTQIYQKNHNIGFKLFKVINMCIKNIILLFIWCVNKLLKALYWDLSIVVRVKWVS